MQPHAKMTRDGRVLIPAAIRKAMELPVGAVFEVVSQGNDVLLRRDRTKEGDKPRLARGRVDGFAGF